MEEERIEAASAPPVARRAVLGGALGALGAALVPHFSALAHSDGPPPFETARHQFTILEPARIVPPIPIAALDGATATLASFPGKVVLVNLWATWCPACRTELPLLDRLQQSAGRDDLQVVAISVDRDGRKTVAPFVRSLNVRHLAIYLYGMPISYLIDRAGRVRGYLAGEADWTSEAARNLIAYYAGQGAG